MSAPSDTRISSENEPNAPPRTITIGSRNSKLALIQTEVVRASLRSHFPHLNFEIKSMATTGDNNLTKSLYSFGEKSLWTKELEELMLEGSVDLIVHSLKGLYHSFLVCCLLFIITMFVYR